MFNLFDDENKVEEVEEVQKPKVKTLFDHLKMITRTQDPEYFKKLSAGDIKTFSTYMIMRYLSMNPDWTEIINDIQPLTTGAQLKPELVYQILIQIIPPSNIYLQYIKNKSEDKFNEELVNIFTKFYSISKKEAIEYLHILYTIPNGMDEVTRIVSMHGKDEKEIKKLIKIK